MKKHAILLFILGCSFISTFTQPLKPGIPFIKNYTVDEYKADNQNWSIVQDSRGIMYFANNWGVLEYNGSVWRIIASANNFSTIRSLAIDNKGRMYVGAFNEFGFINSDKYGNSWYQSLINKIPEKHRKFNDVWQIFQTTEGIFFQSSYSAYWLVDDTIKTITYPTESRKSFMVNNRLFLKFNDGLRELIDDKLVDIPSGNLFGSMYIAFMLPFGKDKILIGSETNGLYIYDFKKLTPFPTQIDEQIKQNKLYCGTFTSEGSIALGTVHNGLYVIDLNGQPLLHLNTDNGLQNNTILSMRNDNLGNLWLTMDHGIDYVELASPFTKLRTKEIDGNIYSVCQFQGNLYVATHHGLFYQSWETLKKSVNKIEEFKQITDVSEINWNLSEIDGTLFLGHDNGAYIIENNKAKKISDIKGGWVFKKLNNYNTIIEGTYNGIVIYKKEQNSWVQHKVFTLNESCRLIEEDNDGNIWFTSGYTGIYKIRLNNSADSIISMRLYGNKEGLPVSTYFGVFKVKDEVVFGTQKGVCSYNKSTDKIEPYKMLNAFFKDLHIRKLVEDKNGNIWYIASTSTGCLKLNSDGTYMQVKTPFQKIDDKQLPGFENISFIDNDNVMMGTKYGIINFNQDYKKDYYIPFLTILDKVFITTEPDSVIYQNVVQPIPETVSNEKVLTIPYNQNALRFSFSATFYESTADIVYKYKLDGFDDDWSNWVKKNEKEYTNIPEGNYTFRVKSKNIYGYESSEAIIKLTILAPWYRTTLAYICYAFLCIMIFWFIIFIKNLQFKKEKIALEKDKLKAIRLKMTEHMQEKLQDELSNKNKELASTTMNLVQKNEIIIKIRDKLTSIVETLPEKEQKKLKSLEKLIDDEINDDSYWEQFEHHFNQIHDDFIKRFKTDHTSLTHKDLKMCAYLRMNLSNKEIATLLNITLRGVEASRLRLRKKLDLDKDILLTEYILRY